MTASIRVDRYKLYYENGPVKFTLPVEWSALAKTAGHPNDFEVDASELEGLPAREAILDEIAAYYSRGPIADIIGKDGALLRGQSKFRFYLQIPPAPSRYYEAGKFLSIPMAPPVKDGKLWQERYILDFSGVTHWTEPRHPLDAAEIRAIADRIVKREKIGVTGLRR
ncbi:MAG: hypothetical protein HYX27_00380 [Acidobacteria bacterium]|nr:hypothetical protein [Acidobacteriota bacterium]